MSLLTNLVAYYKLEDNTDSVGSNTLTAYGSIPFNAAKIDNGADGGTGNTTKYLKSSTPTFTYAQIGAGYTISMWLKLYSTGTNQNIGCVNAVSGANIRNLDFWLQGSNGHIQARHWKKTGVGDGVADGGAWPDTTNFHHLVQTYDGSVLTIYVDNSAIDTDTHTFDTTASPNVNVVSLLVDGANGDVNKTSGIVDEVGYWTRCLDSSEVSSLYNSGSGLQYPFGSTATPQLAMIGQGT